MLLKSASLLALFRPLSLEPPLRRPRIDHLFPVRSKDERLGFLGFLFAFGLLNRLVHDAT